MQVLSQILSRHATALMLMGVLTGLLVQPLAAQLSPYVLYMSMGAMFLSALRIDPRQLRAWAQRTRLLAAVWVWTLLVIPAVVWLALPVLNLPLYMGVGLLLLAATPPIISVGPYCALLGTDAEMLLTMVLPATVISILTLPLFAALSGVPGLSPATCCSICCGWWAFRSVVVLPCGCGPRLRASNNMPAHGPCAWCC